jgi:hypothetical protein
MSDNKSPALSDWQTGLLRLTAFYNPEISFDTQDWWEKVVGTEPETHTSRQRGQQIISEGAFENGKLTLIIQPDRIEWRYVIVEDISETEVEFQTLGTLVNSLNTFKKMAKQWLKMSDIPTFRRLAFGAVLRQPVRDFREGHNLLLSNYLRFDPNLDNSTDFLFQINRPIASSIGINSLNMNRLTKWSMLRQQQGTIVLTPAPVFKEREDLYIVRLELDINTSADFQEELPSDRLNDIFDELVKLGMEIAEKGDIS